MSDVRYWMNSGRHMLAASSSGLDPEQSLDGINPTRRRNRSQDGSRRRELNLIKLIVEVMRGLPVGSTPERPEGTEYNEVPPEEMHRRMSLVA